MILFDFEYYKPDSIQEAIDIYQELMTKNKKPVFFSGGTEIITLGRINKLRTGAIIDIKGIPECSYLEVRNNQLIMGAAVSLTRIAETNLFPLLTESAGRVADHTSRGKITLGGNICGNFIYREAVLALLTSESSVTIASPKGLRTVPIMEAFNEQLQLDLGEFLVQAATNISYLNLPHRGVKKTRMDRIGYPLISLAALKVNNHIKIAFSGLCAFPFRSLKIEDELNSDRPYKTRIDNAIHNLPAPILNDVEGSADYREFVFRNTLHDTLTHFEGV